ncbi:MAG: hypothetical protein KBD14_01135 [Candidatus Pacebacteria bacterium]|nr:hypothetical protein [Candidatus Paceibacterota bacterium]
MSKDGAEVKKAPELLSVKKQASLAGFITEKIINGSSVEQVEYWLGHKEELTNNLNLVFSLIPEDEYFVERQYWQKFYKDQFDWTVDFSQIIIPEKPKSGNWILIFIAEGMTMNLAFKKASKLFAAWKCADDLNKTTPNVRNTKNSYAVWVKDYHEFEPYPEFLFYSTRLSEMLLSVTLLEVIILEMKYFTETGNHFLKNKVVIFCGDSRYSDGRLSCVYLINGCFRVDWSVPGDSDSDYGISA